jgi:hypothetical protein
MSTSVVKRAARISSVHWSKKQELFCLKRISTSTSADHMDSPSTSRPKRTGPQPTSWGCSFGYHRLVSDWGLRRMLPDARSALATEAAYSMNSTSTAIAVDRALSEITIILNLMSAPIWRSRLTQGSTVIGQICWRCEPYRTHGASGSSP